MNPDQQPRVIELIPISLVSVLNPRARNTRIHREIIDNIDEIGLKRPITVSRRVAEDGGHRYDLVCGQGRLEAFRVLGETEIPAIVVDVSESDCLVMGLVENVARRRHRAMELMQEVGSLRNRGYSDSEIARKIGVSVVWVGMIAGLLERGEERLVAAVETGLIPVSFAVEISRSSDIEIQRALADAYAQGTIRGRKLGVIRRLLDQRARVGKSINNNPYGRKESRKPLTPDEVLRLFRREADRQRLPVKKVDFIQSRLIFIVEAMKDLYRAEGFVELLRSERLDNLPRWLGIAVGDGKHQ
jgi:ParB family chromosome partitioning protein